VHIHVYECVDVGIIVQQQSCFLVYFVFIGKAGCFCSPNSSTRFLLKTRFSNMSSC